jgi:hypothetical protein
MTVGGRTIHAPNRGIGFRHWPNPRGIAWAVKQYKGFGGKWRPRKEAMLAQMGQGAVLITRPDTAEHKRMLKLQENDLVYAKTAADRHYWDLTAKGQLIAAAILQRAEG